MKVITHYPGGEPVVQRQRLDVDTVMGVMSVALLCAGLWLFFTA